MTAVELESLLTDTCAQLGVTTRELRYGTHVGTRNGGRLQGECAVGLARHLFLWRAWRAGAMPKATAQLLVMSRRNVGRWFADFRARQARRAA